MSKSLRGVLGVVLPAGWIAGALLPFALAWHQLPEPMASHWSFVGGPDGALPRVVMLAICGGMALLAAIGAWVATRPGREKSVGPACAMVTFLGVGSAGISALAIALNLDAADWHAARSMPLVVLFAGIAGSAALAAYVSRRARTLAPAVATAYAVRPSIGLGASERAMWVSTAHNDSMVLFAVALAGISAALLAVGPEWTAATPGVIAIACAAFARIRVQIDEHDVRIAFGPWGFPRMRVPLARIREARAIELSPLSWGYRGSLRIGGRAAIIIRRGEAVELTLDDGEILSITVDDAATGAGLVNDLVARG